MKTLLFYLMLCAAIYAQNPKFAWITDIHIGYPGADAELDSVVMSINSLNDLSFVIASGDITEKGLNSELNKAHEILNKLDIPLYIIPGNHDTKWSESGMLLFNELWGDNKFSFVQDSILYIGINSGIPWRGGGGHIAPEDLRWLEKEIQKKKGYNGIFFFVHHMLNDQIDNRYKVINLLPPSKTYGVFCGHVHKNQITDYSGLPGATSRATLSKGKSSWGYTIVEQKQDSLLFYEIERDTIPRRWGGYSFIEKKEITLPESEIFENKTAEITGSYDLGYTLSASLFADSAYIYAADYSGLVSCLDTAANVIWEYDTFGNTMSRPVAADGILAAATLQGDLITLDAGTGSQLQSIGFDETITSQLVVFDHNGPKQMLVPKNTDSEAAVVFGTASGKLYCYDLETLERIWVNEEAKGMIEVEPLIYEGKIIYGSWDGYLYCIDANSGLLLWKWSENPIFYYSPAACHPVTNGRDLFITTPEKYVYSINLLLGKTNWKKKVYRAWESIGISEDGKKLFIKSMEDKFHVIYTTDGNWIRERNPGFGIDTMPVEIIEWNNNILFGSKNGFIYKADKKYHVEKMLYMGSSRVHTVRHIRNNLFAASNMDGNIVIFKLN